MYAETSPDSVPNRYDSDMSPRLPRRPTRVIPVFDAKSIGEEIERGRVRAGLQVEEVWELIGLSNRPHWYDRINGAKPFRWDEVGKCAALFKAPKGWPILDWDTAERLWRDAGSRDH